MRVDERRDDQPEGERDAEQVRAGDGGRGLARERQRGHDRAGADKHEQGGAERLGKRPLAERVLGSILFLLRMMGLTVIRQCRMRFATYSSEAGESSGGGEHLSGDHRGGVGARQAA